MSEHQPPKGVLHVDFAPGRLGNKMLQYMTAIAISDRLSGFVLSGIKIEEWGIDIPTILQSDPKTLRISSEITKRIDMKAIQDAVQNEGINRIELNIYCSHVKNLLPHEKYRNLFQADAGGYGENTLLIHIRGDDVLRAVHKHYVVLPIEFYAEVIEKTGLKPVFLGQVNGNSCYIRRLRRSFPRAQFVSNRSAVEDFTVIRRSKNILPSISTFSWLAAWLSDADRIIMPLSGFCNPLQYPRVDLAPEDDSRFSFYLFPVNHAVPDEQIECAHRALLGKWRTIRAGELRGMKCG